MNDNTQKWIFVISTILIPFIVVHLFPDSLYPRLVSIIWLFSVIPVIGIISVVSSKQSIFADTSRILKRIKPEVLKKWDTGFKLLIAVLVLLWFLCFTLPILKASYGFYINREPLTVITDFVVKQSSTVFSPGLYWNLKLSQNPSVGYAYWLPTVNRFGDAKYKFEILTGTDFVLNVSPVE